MDVALDCRLLHRKTSGLERYLRSLITGLSRGGDGNRYRAYVEWPTAPEPTFAEAASVTQVRNDAGLIRELLRRPAAVYHAPWLGLSLSHFLPLLLSRASVVTVPDLIQFHFPEYLLKRLRTQYRELLTGCVPWADLVVVYSNHTKRDVIDHLDIPADRVVAVPLGVGEQFTPSRQGPALDWVRSKYGIDGPFILHVGKDYPHKNLVALADAFVRLKRTCLPEHFLVLAGESVWPETRAKLKYKFELANVRHSVTFIDHVPDDELPMLYQAADVLAFPSLYEGFGLPPVEAMACGTPVVCSDATSLPEIVGDAGLLLDARSSEALAAGIERAILDADCRRRLVERGFEKARKLSWEETAKNMSQAYKSAFELGVERNHRFRLDRGLLYTFPDDLQLAREVLVPRQDHCLQTVASVLFVNSAPCSHADDDAPAISLLSELYYRGLVAKLGDLLEQKNVLVDFVELSKLRGLGHLKDVVGLLHPKAVVIGSVDGSAGEVVSVARAVGEGDSTDGVVWLRAIMDSSSCEANDGALPVVVMEDVLKGIIPAVLDRVLSGSTESNDSLDVVGPTRSGPVGVGNHSTTASLASRLGLPGPLAVIAAGPWPNWRGSSGAMEYQSRARRGVESVFEEISQLQKNGSLGSVLIVDDTLFEDRARAEEFAGSYKRRGLSLHWGCIASVSSLRCPEEVVASLVSAGLALVILQLGLVSRSSNDDMLQVTRVVEALRRAGVRTCASYMFRPGQSKSDVVDTVRTIQSLRPDLHDPVLLGEGGEDMLGEEDSEFIQTRSSAGGAFLRAAVAESRHISNGENSTERIIELRGELARVEQELRRQFEYSCKDSRELVAHYQQRCSQLEEQVDTLQRNVLTLLELHGRTTLPDHKE